MIVLRKLLATLFWWAIFFAISFMGLIVYILLRVDLGTDQATAQAAALGRALGERHAFLLVFGTLALAAHDSILGLLPFSRHRKN